MTAPGDEALMITLLATFTACTGYAAGRLHQWRRSLADREDAYRDGYDEATHNVFSMAARIASPHRATPTPAPSHAPASTPMAAPLPASGVGPGPRSAPLPQVAGAAGGRHHVPDELVEAATYRLPPDRVARAKVPGSELPSAGPDQDSGGSARAEGSRAAVTQPVVPRPRTPARNSKI